MLTQNASNIGIFVPNFICNLENGIDVDNVQGFYGRVNGRDIAFQPTKPLWLIQRDFLEGKTVQQIVNEGLQQE